MIDDAASSPTGSLVQVASATPEAGKPEPDKPIPPAARRALAEAAARRAALDEKAAALQARPEVQGRGGPDPVRYEDWEIKGRTVDF